MIALLLSLAVAPLAVAGGKQSACAYEKLAGEIVARSAGLKYLETRGPGITRKVTRSGIRYFDAKGRPVRDEKTLERIRALRIPPGYEDVWISPDPLTHLQAVGFNSAGKLQYRYHPVWNDAKAMIKFERVLKFGERMPGIRKTVRADLAREGMPREKAAAAVVSAMDQTSIRVGNDEFARNGTYGLTTLLDRHVAIETGSGAITFTFKGKSGVKHSIGLEDKELARVIRAARDLEGSRLFQFVDGQGKIRKLSSDDVNAYLKEISGGDFSAKDFRTWNGTTRAAARLLELARDSAGSAAASEHIAQAVKAASDALGNTEAIARKAYIHPRLLKAYEEKDPLFRKFKPRPGGREARERLLPEEEFVLKLLGSSDK